MPLTENTTFDTLLNRNVRGLTPSPTLAINERSNALRRQGRDIYKLGLGQSPFPVPSVVVEALKANAHQKDYLPVKGLPDLREAVAGYHRRVHGIEREGEDVLIGPGSKELIFLLQLVFEAKLALPSPSWVTYAPQAEILGKPFYWLPTSAEEAWRLQPETLERLGRARPETSFFILLNYPCNPTGQTYSADQLQALAEVARRYGMVILSDEIYGELDHEAAHVSMASFYPEGTIVTAGLSKWCGAGGWRLGTSLFPPSLHDLLDATAAVASETFTAVSAPIQYGAVRAFEGGPEIDRYLHQSRRILRALGRHCARRLQETGATVDLPEGAFYLFPDLTPLAESLRTRGIHTNEELCERLLEDTGVAVLPGSAFGRALEEFTVRLAYVNFDGERALAAAAETPDPLPLPQDFLKTHCGRAVEAIERMGNWLHGS